MTNRDTAGRYTNTNTALRTALNTRGNDSITAPKTEHVTDDANNLLRTVINSPAARRDDIKTTLTTPVTDKTAPTGGLTDLLRAALYGTTTTNAQEANQ